MTTQLVTIISIHTYLALIASAFFYSFLIGFLNKKPASERSLRFKSGAAFLASLLTYISGWYLSDYFVGKLGFITEFSVSTFVSTLLYVQQLLLPTIAAAGLIIFLIIWKKGSVARERPLIFKTVTALGFLGFVGGAALMFLGVLIP